MQSKTLGLVAFSGAVLMAATVSAAAPTWVKKVD